VFLTKKLLFLSKYNIYHIISLNLTMIRIFIILVLILIVLHWWRRANPPAGQQQKPAASSETGEVNPQPLLSCQYCGLRFPANEAVGTTDGQTYCCEAHRQAAAANPAATTKQQ
jgi:hypothetical protein